MAVLGNGTDTGNSIRKPAATSALVSVFPTRGLVSIAGIAPLDWLLDNTGRGRNDTDAALALGVMVGEDVLDPVTKGSAAKAQADRIPATSGLMRRFGAPKFSINTDQGAEMAQHARLKVDTGVQVYFCDPQSPWQRGTNENTNGLLRQYFPKGTDLSGHNIDALAAVAATLNARPRKTLRWKTPAEALDQYMVQIKTRLVATTG